MKLTKAKLQKIIKEEIGAVSSTHWAYDPDSGEMKDASFFEMKDGQRMINKVKARFPAIIEILPIDDYTLQQIAAEAVVAEYDAPGPTNLDSNLFFTHVNNFLQQRINK